MATTAANASNLKFNNFNSQQIQYNNIHNTIITLFNTSTKSINTLFNTTLKTLLQVPYNSSTFFPTPTQTPHLPPSTKPPFPSSHTIPKGPLPPPIPNLKWRVVHFSASHLLIPFYSPYFLNPSLIYRKDKEKNNNNDKKNKKKKPLPPPVESTSTSVLSENNMDMDPTPPSSTPKDHLPSQVCSMTATHLARAPTNTECPTCTYVLEGEGG